VFSGSAFYNSINCQAITIRQPADTGCKMEPRRALAPTGKDGASTCTRTDRQRWSLDVHSHRRQAKDFFEQSRADDDCNNARMPLSLSDLKRTRPTCGRERRSWRVDGEEIKYAQAPATVSRSYHATLSELSTASRAGCIVKHGWFALMFAHSCPKRVAC